MYLILDTETSGFLPAGRAVQVGAIVVDGEFRVKAEANFLLSWGEAYEMHPKALEAHGISREQAQQFGVDPALLLEVLAQMAARAQTLVCHNLDFDRKIIENLAARAQKPNPLAGLKHYCTMLAMTPVCDIQRKGGGTKWPNLQEAHRFVAGFDFDGAHDAMADVRACARVFQWLQEKKAPAPKPIV
jgi:DNA polymerase III subunit epsilon